MTLTHAVQTSVSQCWDLENTRKINTEPYNLVQATMSYTVDRTNPLGKTQCC